jgi:hypothetical protein
MTTLTCPHCSTTNIIAGLGGREKGLGQPCETPIKCWKCDKKFMFKEPFAPVDPVGNARPHLLPKGS